MEEKEKKKETKKQEPTMEEARSLAMDDLNFYRNITNVIKQMRENGCINPSLEQDVKGFIETQVRAILGLPEKPQYQAYQPPPPTQPPQQGQQQYNPPPHYR